MKKYLFSILILIIATFCIIFPQDMINASKSGLTLWYSIIVPSLLPFLILSDLITKSALPYLFSKILSPIMQSLFHLPGSSAIAVFLGLTGGYPIGAKTTADLQNNGSISITDANHLITFVNNSGPLFILGAIGIGLYHNKTIGILLLLSHYLSALLTGFFFRFSKKQVSKDSQQYRIQFEVFKLSKLTEILTESIKKSVQLIFIIGGFILIFSILTTILEKSGILLLLAKLLFHGISTETAYSILTGILEVTNGINRVATLSLPLLHKLIITSILTGFAGFSVHLQTLSVITNSAISFKRYLLGKLIQSFNSGAITYLLLTKTSFSNLIAQPVVATPLYSEKEIGIIFSCILLLFLFATIFKLFTFIHQNR